jgi:hypothetical protein
VGVGESLIKWLCGRGGEFDKLVFVGGGVDFVKLVIEGVLEILTNRLLWAWGRV